jgi:hypothetical protein
MNSSLVTLTCRKVADASLCGSRLPIWNSIERVARFTATWSFGSQGVRPHIVVDHLSMSALAILNSSKGVNRPPLDLPHHIGSSSRRPKSDRYPRRSSPLQRIVERSPSSISHESRPSFTPFRSNFPTGALRKGFVSCSPHRCARIGSAHAELELLTPRRNLIRRLKPE